MKQNKIKKRFNWVLVFYLSILQITIFLFGFMIGDIKEIITATSKEVYKNYLLFAEIIIAISWIKVYMILKGGKNKYES